MRARLEGPVEWLAQGISDSGTFLVEKPQYYNDCAVIPVRSLLANPSVVWDFEVQMDLRRRVQVARNNPEATDDEMRRLHELIVKLTGAS